MRANPVLRGFNPDPSIVRARGRYYVATSSFEWFPTIPIHASRDLSTWTYAGQVDTAVPGGTLDGVADSGGIWAPSLSYARDRFWVTYSIVRGVSRRTYDLDTYVATADDPAAGWSEPVRVPSHGFDPSLFHHDGRVYLLNLQNDHRVGGARFAGIVCTELDPDSLAQVGRTRLLLQHTRLVEGPKMLHRNGWFYLVLAEGGTSWQHGVLVARSRTLDGPYEVDAVSLLTTRDVDVAGWSGQPTLLKVGHGELVEDPSGRWFMSHLASRPQPTPEGPVCILGRETAIQEIVWIDDWPRLLDGGTSPASGFEPVDVGDADDLPARRHPQAGWSSLREPADPDWAHGLGRDRVVLRGRTSIESWFHTSLVAQRVSEHAFTAAVTVRADPTTFAHAAGLALWYNRDAYALLQVTWSEPNGEPQAGQQFVGAGHRVINVVTRTTSGVTQSRTVDASGASSWRLVIDVEGLRARFTAAPIQGDHLGEPVVIADEVDISDLSDDRGATSRFTGLHAALHVMDLIDATWQAEFDGFTLTY